MKHTILSFGGGQDSTAILLKIIHDPDFKAKYVEGKLLVVMSDTGNEHPRTYLHVKQVQKLCMDHGIHFHFIQSEDGWHSESWKSLTHQWERNNTIGSRAFSKSCTDNLKIKPIYNFLAWYFSFYVPASRYRKKSLISYAAIYGKLKVLIGIAHGEEKRVEGKDKRPLWMQKSIEAVYPLIPEKMDRKACQQYIGQFMDVPPPSNCIFCHFLSKIELLWLFNNHPDWFYQWVEYERRKLEKNKDREINYGVFGKKTLEEVLEEAIEEHGHMSDAELEEHKMSHGHCVMSKY